MAEAAIITTNVVSGVGITTNLTTNSVVSANVITGGVGPDGPTGPIGPTGPQGDQGPVGLGLPAGGTTGQILSKVDNDDYNVTWDAPGAGDMLTAMYDPAGIEEQLVGLTASQTLTNKRISVRVDTVASSATPTINTDTTDMFTITALAVNITSMTTNLSGTPTEGQTLWIAITGTAARTIAWGASFEASTIPLPTTTVTTERLDVGFVWNSATSKWRCLAVA